MKSLVFLVAFLLAAGCGLASGAGDSLVEGPLPSAQTEIGRVARGPAYYCGDIGYVDMGAAVDGPAYFFRRRDGAIIGHCGGYCMGDPEHRCARECPPPGWTCTRRLPQRGSSGG